MAFYSPLYSNIRSYFNEYDEPVEAAPLQGLLSPDAGQQAPQVRSTSLEDQIRQRWGAYGDWNAQGVDRSQELANLLRNKGVNNLGDLSLGERVSTEDPSESGYRLRIGDTQIGYLGDYNNDGTYGTNSRDDALFDDAGGKGKIGWSSRGHGNVRYDVQKDPNTGQLYIAPTWNSSSDMGNVRTIAKLAAAVYGGAQLGALGAAEGAAGAGSLTAGITPEAVAAFEAGLPSAAGSLTAGITPAAIAAGEAALPSAAGSLTAGITPAAVAAAEAALPTATGSLTAGITPAAVAAAEAALPSAGPLDAFKTWATANPMLSKLLFTGATSLLSTSGGGGGGGGYVDSGYRPTISRGGFQARVPTTPTNGPTGLLNPSMKPVTLPSTGQANDGLWRYGLLGPGRG